MSLNHCAWSVACSAAGDLTLGEAATLVGMSKSSVSECDDELNWQFRIAVKDD